MVRCATCYIRDRDGDDQSSHVALLCNKIRRHGIRVVSKQSTIIGGERMKMYIDTNYQLKETYQRIKRYLDRDMHLDRSVRDEIEKMCSYCDCYCGNEHNYEECRKKPCFNFFLAFEYLELTNSYHGNEKIEI